MLAWPPQRFDLMYMAMVRRQTREALERRRDLMVAALWANSNYDDKEADRTGVIGRVEDAYAKVIGSIYGVPDPDAEAIPDTEFFQAMRRNLADDDIDQPTASSAAHGMVG